jgi:putative flippase GtrA
MVTTFERDRRAAPAATELHPRVDIVVPVYNEAHVLDANITRLHHYLRDHFPVPWQVTIADNASDDGTWQVAQSLHARYPRVKVLHLDEKGRGRALKAAWSASDAEVVAYMDIDLSTDLNALFPLVAPLLSGHSDLAIGSRLARGARVTRGAKREVISRTYNRLLRFVLRAQFHDAQCGFKAVRADVARALLPAVQDNGWFFDTELLVTAERNGLRIAEVPVDWVDDPDSRVDIVRTALDDLHGVWRLARTFWFHPESTAVSGLARRAAPDNAAGSLVRFVAVGAVCTLLYLAAFLTLQATLGAYAANAVALTATMLINTAAHRRYTFGHRGPGGRLVHYARALGVHLAGLAITTGALLVVLAAMPSAGVALQAVVVTIASMIASGLRFVLMPTWVFHRASEPVADTPSAVAR